MTLAICLFIIMLRNAGGYSIVLIEVEGTLLINTQQQVRLLVSAKNVVTSSGYSTYYLY
jgi:hypothetical protein